MLSNANRRLAATSPAATRPHMIMDHRPISRTLPRPIPQQLSRPVWWNTLVNHDHIETIPPPGFHESRRARNPIPSNPVEDREWLLCSGWNPVTRSGERSQEVALRIEADRAASMSYTVVTRHRHLSPEPASYAPDLPTLYTQSQPRYNEPREFLDPISPARLVLPTLSPISQHIDIIAASAERIPYRPGPAVLPPLSSRTLLPSAPNSFLANGALDRPSTSSSGSGATMSSEPRITMTSTSSSDSWASMSSPPASTHSSGSKTTTSPTSRIPKASTSGSAPTANPSVSQAPPSTDNPATRWIGPSLLALVIEILRRAVAQDHALNLSAVVERVEAFRVANTLPYPAQRQSVRAAINNARIVGYVEHVTARGQRCGAWRVSEEGHREGGIGEPTKASARSKKGKSRAGAKGKGKMTRADMEAVAVLRSMRKREVRQGNANAALSQAEEGEEEEDGGARNGDEREWIFET